MTLKHEIIIIGAARSGTTMLGNILALHPDIAYLEEPNVIWKYRNAHKKNDLFTVLDADKTKIDYINNKFVKFVKDKNKIRLLEKTPSNSLRLSFVRKVFPKSKIIILVRDGRDVAVSARKKWLYETDKNTQKLNSSTSHKKKHFNQQVKKFLQISFLDFPYYLKDIFSELLFYVGLRKRSYWGPKIPGISELSSSLSPLEICAFQWKACVEQTDSYMSIDANQEDFIYLKYEDFCINPKTNLQNILKHCDLTIPENFNLMCQKVEEIKANSWKEELSDDEIKKINALLKHTLKYHGYLK